MSLLDPVSDLGGGVRAGFTARTGGTSTGRYAGLNLGAHVGDDPARVAANRAALAGELGVDVAFMHQVHGADVAVLDAPADPPPVADALLTAAPGLALAVLVADCRPVLLADPARGLLAAVHVGRGGLAAGVLPAALTALGRLGAGPETLRAVVGPGVCGGCYEVPAELREQVAAQVPAAAACTRAGTPALDLLAGVQAQLAAAGVADVQVDRRCTLETAGLYSYRREQVTGRFAGLVWRVR